MNAIRAEVAAGLLAVRERIAESAIRAGRSPGEVTLVAVSKYANVEQIRAAADAGQIDFGENYVAEGLRKIESTTDLSLRWHMIGQLQSNKAAKAARGFDVIESLSGIRPAERVSRAMTELGESRTCYMQIRLGGPDGRGGVDPAEAEETAERIAAMPGIVLDGVMGVAPEGVAPRPYFATLRKICEKLRARRIESAPLTQISAGMSSDFDAAIAEGATSVRIGRAIFGRNQANGGTQ